MDLVLELVIPYVDDDATAARLRAVSKRAKTLVDADAHHTDRIRRAGEYHGIRIMVRMYEQNLMHFRNYWASSAVSPPVKKKTGFWRRLSKLISRAN